MAYSELEQTTVDLDLFLKDYNKFIHIASGGGKIPNSLAETDVAIEEFKIQLENLNDILAFEFEINPNLNQILDLNPDENMANYLESFIEKAKQGFYSYDKTNLGNFNDTYFHLVARPYKKNKFIDIDYSNILEIEQELPTTFEPFNINNYIQ